MNITLSSSCSSSATDDRGKGGGGGGAGADGDDLSGNTEGRIAFFLGLPLFPPRFFSKLPGLLILKSNSSGNTTL